VICPTIHWGKFRWDRSHEKISYRFRRAHRGRFLLCVSTPARGEHAPVQSVVKDPAIVYKDGTYTGNVADAYYGNVQVQTTIQGGKIAGVTFLQSPSTHGTSIAINDQAIPYLKQEAIQSQSANVDIISGATDTSMAFQQSLAAALAQAQS
jgi:uncharacterized protein with FMN-binding domain